MMTPHPLIAGNWKMNGLRASLAEIAKLGVLYDPSLQEKTDLLICPPATLLAVAEEIAAKGKIALGGQNCHFLDFGPHTGDLSARMLKDAGASYVIVGHSERRQSYQETDAVVQAKAEAALHAGLTPIICVGETGAQRRAGVALAVVEEQIKASLPAQKSSMVVVAYEPVWAIGTGLTPTSKEIAEVHAFTRETLKCLFGSAFGDQIRLLYGGSVSPANATEILKLKNVDGALVGGASLKAEDFINIARAYV
jgi:triosephosphate isomerase